MTIDRIGLELTSLPGIRLVNGDGLQGTWEPLDKEGA